jgi:hypothetical protein
VSGSSRCRFPPAARRARPARSTPGRAVARGGSRRSSTAASDVRAPVRRCARSDAIGRRRDRFAQQSREPPADEDVDPVELRVTAPLRPASLSSRRAIPSSQSTASPRAGSKRWASSSAVANVSAHSSAANPRSWARLAKCSSSAATWRREKTANASGSPSRPARIASSSIPTPSLGPAGEQVQAHEQNLARSGRRSSAAPTNGRPAQLVRRPCEERAEADSAQVAGGSPGWRRRAPTIAHASKRERGQVAQLAARPSSRERSKRRPVSLGSASSFSRARRRVSASETSRCWAPSCRCRSSRRRSRRPSEAALVSGLGPAVVVNAVLRSAAARRSLVSVERIVDERGGSGPLPRGPPQSRIGRAPPVQG